MSARPMIQKLERVLTLAPKLNLSTPATGVHNPAPVRYPSLANLSTKEMGEWYRTTFVRW